MAQLFNGDRLVALDNNGRVIAGALLYFYQTGTTTPQTVYSDSGATVALSNPVPADSGGLFPAIYLSNVNAYKTILKTAGDVLVRTTDPVNSGTGASTTFTPQGRLTLASGTPVMTASQASATTIYYTPYNGNQIPLYDGTSSFAATPFGELTNNTTQSSTGSAGPAAVAANKNYDLFVWSNAGVATLTRGAAWNSDTLRSATTENNLTRVNGVWVNLNAIANGPAANRGTYVGTVRSDGSSQINWVFGAVAANGTAALLGVWNMYNRVRVRGFIGDTTDTWNYTTATWRAANASNTMRVSYVKGMQEDYTWANYTAMASNASGAQTFVGIGFDSTSAVSGRVICGLAQAGATNLAGSGEYADNSLGFHFLQAIEQSQANGTTSWTGDNAGAVIQSGLTYDGQF
jgi:hypothetical protein